MERIVPYEKEEIIYVRILTVIGASALDGVNSDFRCWERTVPAHCKRYQRHYTAN